VQSLIDQSIPWLERGRSANPAFASHHAWLAAAYALKEDTERAAFELTEARRLSGEDRYSSIACVQNSVADWPCRCEPTQVRCHYGQERQPLGTGPGGTRLHRVSA
jgi:hypothetical protein